MHGDDEEIPPREPRTWDRCAEPVAKTRSWTRIAASSHARTPRNAYRGGGAAVSSNTSAPCSSCRARQSVVAGG